MPPLCPRLLHHGLVSLTWPNSDLSFHFWYLWGKENMLVHKFIFFSCVSGQDRSGVLWVVSWVGSPSHHGSLNWNVSLALPFITRVWHLAPSTDRKGKKVRAKAHWCLHLKVPIQRDINWLCTRGVSNSSRTELFANFSEKARVRQVRTVFLSSQTVCGVCLPIILLHNKQYNVYF
jgi:hypothetical protein